MSDPIGYALVVQKGTSAESYRKVLGAGTHVIGRAGACDVLVVSGGTARRHARLVISAEGARLEVDHHGGNTLLNGVAMGPGSVAAVRRGDVLLIGQSEVRVAAAEPGEIDAPETFLAHSLAEVSLFFELNGLPLEALEAARPTARETKRGLELRVLVPRPGGDVEGLFIVEVPGRPLGTPGAPSRILLPYQLEAAARSAMDRGPEAANFAADCIRERANLVTDDPDLVQLLTDAERRCREQR